jgi:membrane fusion protein, multidrug efflux system
MPDMRKLTQVVLGVLIGLLTGCEEKKPVVAPTAPPVVTVSQPISKMVTEYIEYTGYTSADKTVDLRSQVKGYLDSTQFKPRDRVKAGQLLFQIDPRPYQADLDKAKADLAVAEAQVTMTEARLVRVEDALKKGASTEMEAIEERANRDKAKADIGRCKALLETAQLNLDYTRIIAPIDGLMSRDLPTRGDLIVPQQTLLSTITDDSVIYAYFNVSEYDLLRLRDMARSAGQSMTAGIPAVPVYMGLADETGYPHRGVLDYVAPQVDRSTGTVEVRARFENKDRALLSGLFVKVRVPVSDPRPALLVAERAMGMDQGQQYLLVVNDKNVVEYRLVRTGTLEEGLRVIDKGLVATDWVIVNGLQRVRPGVTVSPQRAAMESLIQAATMPATPATATAPAPATQEAH